ncbi:probable ATP-dependent RNA helicase ddx17 [Monomorium pharaonis]|uniref:probable ATP-dependent RNA helicase ddx17 n=1 Tax=Monomorium pharaonis TaxID=307658 RepID=UPI00063EDE26|nr:probable ATP-dependent RNA helicase ddx17 [Monomorium pharaonis]
MLLSAVIICCMIVANAEPPLNSYSFTGDSNGYDYGNTVTSNGYLGSKDGYQNGGGSFYGTGDINHKLSSHVGSHSLINIGNQAGIGGSDVGNSYNGYSANDHGNEYAGYANIYGNSASESNTTPNRATSTLRGYIGANNNGESTFNAYSSDSINKDSDFGQYAAASSSSSKKIPAYLGFSRPTRVPDNYPEGSADNGSQGYRGSESDHIYAPYSSGGLTSEYLFGKQKNDPLNLKGGNKYSGVYSIPSETRYTRGNTGHVIYNRDVPSFVLGGSRLSSLFSKAPGIYSSTKSNKYGSKYLSRYAPNSEVTYVSRERDNYYMPYGKGGRKVIVIKDNNPSYTGRVYSDEPLYAGSDSSYIRSKSGFANGYSASPNFDGYTGSSSYDDSSTMIRRYRTSSGPMFIKPIYA